MSAILNFLFPGEPRDSRSSWLLLAARVVFGLLLMSHGIAKLQNFEALSATFPDPLGVGSRVSLVLAVLGRSSARPGVWPGYSTGWRSSRWSLRCVWLSLRYTAAIPLPHVSWRWFTWLSSS